MQCHPWRARKFDPRQLSWGDPQRMSIQERLAFGLGDFSCPRETDFYLLLHFWCEKELSHVQKASDRTEHGLPGGHT